MQKQRRNNQETIVQRWGRVLVPPQGIYITISLISSAGTKALTQVEDGNFQAEHRIPETPPCSLPTNQSDRTKSHTLQPSPQILPIETSPPSTIGEFRVSEHEPPVLLARPCSKPFSAPDSDVSVFLASLCIRHMNLRSATCTLRTHLLFFYLALPVFCFTSLIASHISTSSVGPQRPELLFTHFFHPGIQHAPQHHAE